MKILAVDTSTSAATAAIMENDRLISEYILNINKAHSEKIMGIIDDLFGKSGVEPSEIDLYACSAGPGSFTGLRIGASIIKGMAQTFGKPVAGVPTLDALAYNLYNCTGLICPMLDAQRGAVYSSLYSWEKGSLIKQENLSVILINDLIKIIKDKDMPTTFLGDGALLFGDDLKKGLREYYVAPADSLLPRASSCARIAMKMYEKGSLDTYNSFRLTYIRKSQAEAEYEKKQNIELMNMSFGDIDQVCEIENLSFAIPWSRESFESELSQNNLARYIVAKVNGKVVAYGGMWIILDEGHITNIAVHPDYRGQKIGEKLVEALLREAKESNAERITLEVRASNDAARKLYQKQGFTDGGIRKGYYGDNREDAIIMWKKLT
ncbi:MAG TPA: tRNA (adenosine(37)-N6)-threonylcarbamoyltransferase complex dimerization subunit type 1 TsaB [Bacillota bacterium]|nr:tRNA (adenosine(37)-N6)-threonylcarbamoyltransferase complex dimerization subunit type 1 TsaB [Bacillota bacterium]HPL54517.1 tRNA (adenosine(37)-N6)-threonylcarbamoyltransferase complex dimerization subunit type 1 TsaB [Bacillota bacterium]